MPKVNNFENAKFIAEASIGETLPKSNLRFHVLRHLKHKVVHLPGTNLHQTEDHHDCIVTALPVGLG